LKDNFITPLVGCSLPPYSCVTTNGNNMYYTNDRTHKVTCSDMNVKLYDANVLVSPKFITTDDSNNIYVVGQLSHNVAAISSDGQAYTVLLSRRDGVRSPLGTHCDRASKQLLINVSDNTGLLYDISTTPICHCCVRQVSVE
jgi:hypothetical protein